VQAVASGLHAGFPVDGFAVQHPLAQQLAAIGGIARPAPGCML